MIYGTCIVPSGGPISTTDPNEIPESNRFVQKVQSFFPTWVLSRATVRDGYQSLREKKVERIVPNSDIPLEEGLSYYVLIIPDPLRPLWREELVHLKIYIQETLPKSQDFNAHRHLCCLTRHQAILAYHLTFVHSVLPYSP